MKKLLAALLVTVTVTGCAFTPVAAAAAKWAIYASWTDRNNEHEHNPYAPRGRVVVFADQKSCEDALEGQEVQAAVSGLRMVLLMRGGEEVMESLSVACEEHRE